MDTIKRQYISYPTVSVFITSVSLTLLSIYIDNIIHFYTNNILLICIINFVTIVIASIASYSQFTVMHDSVHNSVSKNQFINNTFGVLSSIWLGPTSNWYGFQQHHLLHHKETNNKDLDPDMWCSNNFIKNDNIIFLFCRWATLDFYYIYKTFKNINCMKNVTKFSANQLAMIFLVYYIFTTFSMFSIIKYWILPSRVAILVLSFAFDYLPHYPHIITKKDNRYRTTSYINCSWFIKIILSPIAFYQDYHLIHHLYPNIPFYNYPVMWNKMENYLINECGINVLDISPSNLWIIIEDKIKNHTNFFN